jgi:hypothetical protein
MLPEDQSGIPPEAMQERFECHFSSYLVLGVEIVIPGKCLSPR